MQKITPCLWFDGNAEEAVKFYAAVFGRSKVKSLLRMKKLDVSILKKAWEGK